MIQGFWSHQSSSSRPPTESGTGASTTPNQLSVDPINALYDFGDTINITGTYNDFAQTMTTVEVLRSDAGPGGPFVAVAGFGAVAVSLGVININVPAIAPEGSNVVFKIKDSTGGNNPLAEAITSTTTIADEPFSISDLVVSNPTGGSVQLDWTAPADKPSGADVQEYIVKWSTSIINAGNFDLANTASSSGNPPLAPNTAGTPQTFVVVGIPGGTLIYFAIKSVDVLGAVSDISNVVSETTLVANNVSITSAPGTASENSTISIEGTYSGITEPISILRLYASTDGGATFPTIVGSKYVSGNVFSFGTQVPAVFANVVYKVADATPGNFPLEEDQTVSISVTAPVANQTHKGAIGSRFV